MGRLVVHLGEEDWVETVKVAGEKEGAWGEAEEDLVAKGLAAVEVVLGEEEGSRGRAE